MAPTAKRRRKRKKRRRFVVTIYADPPTISILSKPPHIEVHVLYAPGKDPRT